MPILLRKADVTLWLARGAALGCFALLFMSAPSGAQTASTSVQGSANVITNCTENITQSAPVSYDPLFANATAAATGTAQISLACTKSAPASVDMGAGNNGTTAGSYYAPHLIGTNTGDKLAYFIYKDSAHTQLWGTPVTANGGLTDGGTVTTTGTGYTVVYNVYIVIPGGQDVSADSYSDTPAATVSF